MNLYRIYQTVNKEYDTYDSAVVVAMSEFFAARTHPDGNVYGEGAEDDDPIWGFARSWCKPEQVQVQLIGKALDTLQARDVVCASFNAG